MDSLPLALYVLVLLIPALAVLMAPGGPGTAPKTAIDEIDDTARQGLHSAIAQLAASGLPRRRIRRIAADELRFLTKGI